MLTSEDYRQLAERCALLAGECAKPGVAEELRTLALDYLTRAATRPEKGKHQRRPYLSAGLANAISVMIAQDTGSAIVGPARADLYWGAGEHAARIAGRIHHSGRFVMLLPRELDLAATARQAPLPPPKPKFAEPDAGEEDGKGKVESRDTDRRAKAGLAGHQQLVASVRNVE